MFLHSDISKGQKWKRSLSPINQISSIQPLINSVSQNIYFPKKIGSLKNAATNSSVVIDPFSKICQRHMADSNKIKIVCDDQSMEYILGLRSVAKDIFYEEIPTISKAIYEEVVFRVSSLTKEAPTPRYTHEIDTNAIFSEIEKLLTQSFELHKKSFIDPINSTQKEHEDRLFQNEEKIDKLSEAVDMLASSQT